MKKIVSIVLALVLVLAIAAPAMAITGYVEDLNPTKAAVPPYSGGVSLVAAPQGNTLGILSLSSPATNKAYVANEVVYFRVDLKTATVGTKLATDTTMNEYDYKNGTLTISSTAATLLEMACYEIEAGQLLDGTSGIIGIVGNNGTVKHLGNAKLDTTYNTLSVSMPALTAAPRQIVCIGTGIVKAQGTIQATIKAGRPEKFQAIDKVELIDDSAYGIYNNNGELLYTFKEVTANNSIYVEVIEKGAVIGSVQFLRNEKDVCTDILVRCDKVDAAQQLVDFDKPISNGGQLVDYIGSYSNADKDLTKYNALKAIYDNVMSFFGFSYDAEGKLLDGHFPQKLNSFYAVDSVEVNLYTGAAITVPDPEVEIPQTGDAATTIGFVMVAMAIVAAAAVAYKKVRA